VETKREKNVVAPISRFAVKRRTGKEGGCWKRLIEKEVRGKYRRATARNILLYRL